jgi:hypothetical protein
MIIYNITTQISWNIHDQWRQWMLEIHLPSLLGTGVFSHYRLVRLLEVDEDFGPTYAVQLYVKEDHSIEQYKRCHQRQIEDQEAQMWGDEAYSFASIMQVIN